MQVDSRQDRPSFTIYKDPEPTLSEREGTAELNILSETETEVGRPSSGGASAGPSEGSDAAPRSWFNRLTGVYNVAGQPRPLIEQSYQSQSFTI